MPRFPSNQPLGPWRAARGGAAGSWRAARGGAAWLGLVGLLVLGAPGGSAQAGDRAIYQATVDRIESSYLRLDELDAALAFRLAAAAAEDAVPWLLVETRAESDHIEVVLSHGDRGPFATVTFAPSRLPAGDTAADRTLRREAELVALVAALEQLEDAIAGLAAEGVATVPADVELSVELLRGASRALDRHSVVLAGDRLDRFNERIRGRLMGIGCRIGAQDAGLVIREVFPDGPAERGGLQPDDEVLRIDGISTVGMALDDAVERIRGEKGTPVQLVVRRPGEDAELTYSFLRDEVRIPNVEWGRTAAGAGWIRIDHFSQQTVRLMERALRELAEEPVVKGLVLDLRGNSGGSMLQAAKTVDLFVDEGLILRTGGRDFERVRGLVREVQAWPPDPESDLPGIAATLPLVILQDRSSASASEIVSGSLVKLGRAVILGTSSHGKGTVQQPFVLRPADAERGEVKLKLTIAEYHLAEDTPVQEGVGIAPDVATELVQLREDRAVLPVAATQGGALGFVVEGAGWRGQGTPPDRGDVLLGLAERVISRTKGPRRADALSTARAVLAEAKAQETAALVAAMDARGIDWSGDEFCRGPCPAPVVEVDIEALGVARAGESVQLEARVRNDGPAPLHRVLVRLTAASHQLPWHELSVPIGFVPPGEEARAVVEVGVPMFSASREDLVAVTVEADRRPVVGLPPVRLAIAAEPDPLVALALTGIVDDQAEDTAASDRGAPLTLQLRVDNLSPRALSGVQLRTAHPVDNRLEPLERERIIERVGPGSSGSAELAYTWTGDQPLDLGEPLLLDLEVAAERYGDLLAVSVPVRFDGGIVELDPPWVGGEVPLHAPLGELPLRLRAEDDRGIDSVTVWWQGDKVAWRSGTGPSLEIDLDLTVREGTHALVVDATDDQGVTTRRRWYVRAAPFEDGTAEP